MECIDRTREAARTTEVCPLSVYNALGLGNLVLEGLALTGNPSRVFDVDRKLEGLSRSLPTWADERSDQVNNKTRLATPGW